MTMAHTHARARTHAPFIVGGRSRVPLWAVSQARHGHHVITTDRHCASPFNIVLQTNSKYMPYSPLDSFLAWNNSTAQWYSNLQPLQVIWSQLLTQGDPVYFLSLIYCEQQYSTRKYNGNAYNHDDVWPNLCIRFSKFMFIFSANHWIIITFHHFSQTLSNIGVYLFILAYIFLTVRVQLTLVHI